MALADEGALTDVQVHNFAPESSAVRGTPGSWKNGRGYAESKRRFGRNKRVNNTQMNGRRATYASKPGQKFFELACKIIATEYLYADWSAVFASGLGKELTVSVLVLTGGTGTINGCTLTSGVPDPVVRVGLSNGLFYIVPVKSYNSGTGAVVWGYTLPALGGATITSVQNANQRAGGCIVESLDPPTSFAVESSQGSEPAANQRPMTGQGCVPNLSLEFSDMEKHLEFDLMWRGCDWFLSPAPSNLSDPVNDWSSDFTVQQCDILFQSITTPTTADYQHVSSLKMQLSSEFKELTATQSRLSTGANPGSAVFNVKRGAPMVEDIEIGNRLIDPDWLTARTAETHGMLSFTWYDGDPGATGTRAICILFRNACLDDDPQEGDNGGISADSTFFKVEDPLDADAIGNLKTRCSIHFFMN